MPPSEFTPQQSSTPVPNISPVPTISDQPSPISQVTSEPRRSSRATKGKFDSTRYINEVYLSQVIKSDQSYQDQQLAYLAEIQTDYDSGIMNCQDPRAYTARTKKAFDPDTPNWHEAMHGPEAEHYIDAMKKEISQLMKIKTWKAIPRADVPKTSDGKPRTILKGIWAFKLKRLPDGTALKYKARYCCRGELQTQGVDFLRPLHLLYNGVRSDFYLP